MSVCLPAFLRLFARLAFLSGPCTLCTDPMHSVVGAGAAKGRRGDRAVEGTRAKRSRAEYFKGGAIKGGGALTAEPSRQCGATAWNDRHQAPGTPRLRVRWDARAPRSCRPEPSCASLALSASPAPQDPAVSSSLDGSSLNGYSLYELRTHTSRSARTPQLHTARAHQACT